MYVLVSVHWFFLFLFFSLKIYTCDSQEVEDMLNTVVRQIAFHNFETAFHDARKSGEVSAEALSDLWMQTQTQALGPAVRLDDSYRPIWAYIPHFVHTPFL